MSSTNSEIISYLNSLSEASIEPRDIFIAVAVSLALSVLVAITYEKTHAGATYSRSFVQTIVLGSLVSTIMIIAIGNNIARGLGILGALTIIRFRTPIRDPRDMIFIFAALAIGIASGSRFYALGAIGTLAFCATTFVLEASSFSTRKRFDGMLRLFTPPDEALRSQIMEVVGKYTKTRETIALRDAGRDELLECAIQIRLYHPDLQERLIEELRAIEGVREASLIMQRDSVEI